MCIIVTAIYKAQKRCMELSFWIGKALLATDYTPTACKNTINTAEYAAAAANASNILARVAIFTSKKKIPMKLVIIARRCGMPETLLRIHNGPTNMPNPMKATNVDENPSTLLSSWNIVSSCASPRTLSYSTGVRRKQRLTPGTWSRNVNSSTDRKQERDFGLIPMRSSLLSKKHASSGSIARWLISSQSLTALRSFW